MAGVRSKSAIRDHCARRVALWGLSALSVGGESRKASFGFRGSGVLGLGFKGFRALGFLRAFGFLGVFRVLGAFRSLGFSCGFRVLGFWGLGFSGIRVLRFSVLRVLVFFFFLGGGGCRVAGFLDLGLDW